MIESTLQVNGLLSAGCAPNVEKALMKLPGVHHATANYLNSTASARDIRRSGAPKWGFLRRPRRPDGSHAGRRADQGLAGWDHRAGGIGLHVALSALACFCCGALPAVGMMIVK